MYKIGTTRSELARRTGLSTKTIQRSIHNPEKVAKATLEKIYNAYLDAIYPQLVDISRISKLPTSKVRESMYSDNNLTGYEREKINEAMKKLDRREKVLAKLERQKRAFDKAGLTSPSLERYENNGGTEGLRNFEDASEFKRELIRAEKTAEAQTSTVKGYKKWYRNVQKSIKQRTGMTEEQSQKIMVRTTSKDGIMDFFDVYKYIRDNTNYDSTQAFQLAYDIVYNTLPEDQSLTRKYVEDYVNDIMAKQQEDIMEQDKKMGSVKLHLN